ncbi:MAG: ABC transporter permease [Tissierellales bacterium]|jgi:simple sugar transport system permease protein|nr:ABC transporter permease [Tissierellales bacterium]
MGSLLFLYTAIQAGIPLLFATLGEIITEKAGHLNLGVEGTMLVGAVMGFMVGNTTNQPILAMLAAILGGAFMSLIYAFLTVSLRTNQVVTGLSITILGTGISGFVGQALVGEVLSPEFKSFFENISIPILSKIPYIGPLLFNHNIMVYMGFIIAVVLGFYLKNTQAGLNLRTVGEDPAVADANGVNVNFYKYIHCMIGGGLCGLGGAYLSLIYIPAWQDNITAGRGWIAVALVIFSGWSTSKAVFGALLFGGLDIIGFRIQGMNLPISQYLIDMLPYLVTIFVLIYNAMRKKNDGAPKGLSVPYFREER